MRKLLRAAAVARGRQLPGSRWARRPALLGFPGLGAQRSGRAAEQGGRPTALALSLQPLGRLRPSVYRGAGRGSEVLTVTQQLVPAGQGLRDSSRTPPLGSRRRGRLWGPKGVWEAEKRPRQVREALAGPWAPGRSVPFRPARAANRPVFSRGPLTGRFPETSVPPSAAPGGGAWCHPLPTPAGPRDAAAPPAGSPGSPRTGAGPREDLAPQPRGRAPSRRGARPGLGSSDVRLRGVIGPGRRRPHPFLLPSPWGPHLPRQGSGTASSPGPAAPAAGPAGARRPAASAPPPPRPAPRRTPRPEEAARRSAAERGWWHGGAAAAATRTVFPSEPGRRSEH